MIPAALAVQLPGSPLAGAAEAADPSQGLPGTGVGTPQQPSDPLGTVGLALLAYGLVQLLSKVVDKLPLGRGGQSETQGVLSADDRKRLERIFELAMADHERIQRVQEEVREIHEYTRWASEQRHRVDAHDGEPIWQCKARSVVEQAAVNQRLIGQALDELREMQGKLDDVLRKLRILWRQVGRRRNDRK